MNKCRKIVQGSVLGIICPSGHPSTIEQVNKFCNLFSGSSGNSTYVESPNAKILIDAGVSCQRITKALDSMRCFY